MPSSAKISAMRLPNPPIMVWFSIVITPYLMLLMASKNCDLANGLSVEACKCVMLTPAALSALVARMASSVVMPAETTNTSSPQLSVRK